MPIYEYYCPFCNKTTEEITTKIINKKKIECPHCKQKINKCMSVSGRRYRFMDSK